MFVSTALRAEESEDAEEKVPVGPHAYDDDVTPSKYHNLTNKSIFPDIGYGKEAKEKFLAANGKPVFIIFTSGDVKGNDEFKIIIKELSEKYKDKIVFLEANTNFVKSTVFAMDLKGRIPGFAMFVKSKEPKENSPYAGYTPLSVEAAGYLSAKVIEERLKKLIEKS